MPINGTIRMIQTLMMLGYFMTDQCANILTKTCIDMYHKHNHCDNKKTSILVTLSNSSKCGMICFHTHAGIKNVEMQEINAVMTKTDT